MMVTQEPSGELTALLKVEIKEADYIEKLNKTLKDYQRKANMPGFRPGKVPFGLVKKMYGNAILVDEVNKLVSEQLTSFLRENEIKMLGYPIPNDEKTGQIDWNSQTDFDLYFDLGLAPEFELNFSNNIEIEYLQIKASDEQINEEIERLAKQFGSLEEAEISEEENWMSGEIIPVDHEGNEREGITNPECNIHPASISDEANRDLFLNKKTGDVIDFDIRAVFPTEKDIARLLKTTEDVAKIVHGNYRFTVGKISRLRAAEMNEEFFKKVFHDQEELNEEKFRQLVADYIEKHYMPESDKKFLQDASEELSNLHNFQLPEAFLLRWMIESNKEEVSPADVERDLPHLMKGLKWDLIKQKIAQQYNIKVTEEDLREYVRNYFISRFGQLPEQEDNRMDELVDKVLSKQEDAERIESDIFNLRLLEVMKQNLGLKPKQVSVEEFITLASEKHSHDHDHHHDHDHDHDHDHEHDHHHDHDHKHDHDHDHEHHAH